MGEERMKILEMLEQGKISAKEAEGLMAAMDEADQLPATSGKPRWLRIKVFDKKKNKTKTNINIPLSLAKIALKFIPKKAKEKMDIQGLDVDAVLNMIKQGVSDGKIVEVDEEDEQISVTLD